MCRGQGVAGLVPCVEGCRAGLPGARRRARGASQLAPLMGKPATLAAGETLDASPTPRSPAARPPTHRTQPHPTHTRARSLRYVPPFLPQVGALRGGGPSQRVVCNRQRRPDNQGGARPEHRPWGEQRGRGRPTVGHTLRAWLAGWGLVLAAGVLLIMSLSKQTAECAAVRWALQGGHGGREPAVCKCPSSRRRQHIRLPPCLPVVVVAGRLLSSWTLSTCADANAPAR